MKAIEETIKMLIVISFAGEYLTSLLPDGRLRNTLKAAFVFCAFFEILPLFSA